MSRVGKKPIDIPSGVEVTVTGASITLKGKQGTLEQSIPPLIEVAKEENRLVVTRKRDDKKTRAFHGLTRALLANHVVGVTEGYLKELEVHGVSYQASIQGQTVTLKVGYANEIKLTAPAGVSVECPNPTLIHVRGPDKQKVGQFAAELRAARKPEPYKGKGLRFRGERIQRKQGKSFVGTE